MAARFPCARHVRRQHQPTSLRTDAHKLKPAGMAACHMQAQRAEQKIVLDRRGRSLRPPLRNDARRSTWTKITPDDVRNEGLSIVNKYLG